MVEYSSNRIDYKSAEKKENDLPLGRHRMKNQISSDLYEHQWKHVDCAQYDSDVVSIIE